jgi:hypothetical protein
MKTLTMIVAVLTGLMSSLSASATMIEYGATLTGSAESPPNASPGTGSALVTIDTVAQTMEVSVVFSGLLGGDTASHIHCCTAAAGTGTAGVATITPTFTGFPSGVTSGTYDHIFDLTSASTYNPAFVTAEGGIANAETALLAGLASDESYLNVHSTVVPGGEIRGFLAPVPVPAAIWLFGSALLMPLLRRKAS